MFKKKSEIKIQYYQRIFQKLMDIISENSTKVVSFDVFDTLLIRPAICPEDIFLLIQNKYNLPNFLSDRIEASKNAGLYANIDDIYYQLSLNDNYSESQLLNIKQYELYLEKTILYKRESIYKLYKYALEKNKIVIALSDMYINVDKLKVILENNDYVLFDDIIVSCETKTRKDKGSSYELLLTKYKCKRNEIVHIGDNYISDYLIPNDKGIRAFWYPSCKDMAALFEIGHNRLFDEKSITDIWMRVVYGFVINRCFDDITSIDYNNVLNNKKIFSMFVLFPVVLHIVISVLINENIQNNYNIIYFVARDGYLPEKIYNNIPKKDGALCSKYIYASRKSYQYVLYQSPNERVEKEEFDKSYNLSDLIDSMIYDKEVNDKIKMNLGYNDLQLLIENNKKEVVNLLNNSDLINNFYLYAKNMTKSYYKELINDEGNRKIVFDCGYSGSVSLAIEKSIHKKIDKIYLWQDEKNIKRDKINDTTTITLIGKSRPFWADTLFERLLSSTEGSCIGFYKEDEGNTIPIFESDYYDNSKNVIMDIQAYAEEGVYDFFEIMGSIIDDYKVVDGNSVVTNTFKLLSHASCSQLGVLNDINFVDQYLLKKEYTFAKLISSNRSIFNKLFNF